MLHKNRSWLITTVDSAHDLANKLHNYDWTGCTGLRLGKYLLLNDDGDYGIAIDYGDGMNLAQVESITVRWFKYESLVEYLEAMASGSLDCVPALDWIDRSRLETGPHRCYLCA